jgi:transmembrane sensor
VTTSQSTSIDERIAEEAAQWLLELEEAGADQARFAAWLEASPRHVEEFLLASATWHAFDAMDRNRAIDVAQLVASARGNVETLDVGTPIDRRAAAIAPRRWGPMRQQLAAVLTVLAVGCLLWFAVMDRGTDYVTGVGEQRAFKLPDGSLVTLNTRSRVVVRFTPEARVIELVQGEALFNVQHDTQRPFRVLAGGAAVQAVGTQFNVHRGAQATTVAVLEGIVQVSPVDAAAAGGANQTSTTDRIGAGEQAQVSVTGQVLRHTSAELERVMAWRERRLVFRDEPLASVADEFNRYNNTRLVVEGAATRARRMTGVFNADDPGALIAFLDRDPTLSVQSQQSSVVIRGP